jgi:DNA polymerase V
MHTTGFPSPAQGYEQKTFDFNAILIRHPAATFLMRYTGSELEDEHICPGDLLVVDSAVDPAPGKLAVISADNEFRCARLGQDSVPCASRRGTKEADNQDSGIFGIVCAVLRLV